MSRPRIDRPEEGQSRSDRPKRVPLHRQNIMNVDRREGFERRWVNDQDDRIERFKLAGWSPVEDIKQVGDPHAGDPSTMGAIVTKSVGGGTKSVLMEIPTETYQEDQADKQAKVDQMEESMEKDVRNQLGGSAIGDGIKISRKRQE